MKKAKELLNKYRNGECTPEELALLHHWINSMDNDLLSDELFDAQEFYISKRKIINHQRFKNLRAIYKWAGAAVILFVLSFSTYYFIYHKKLDSDNLHSKVYEDVKPGRDAAVLTLGNGKKIVLNDTTTNNIDFSKVLPGIKKQDDGLNYANQRISNSLPLEFHTIETPIKGQYKLTLSDGSKVWLNSLSSIKFPSRFDTDKREIQLSGEAYFEIAKDPNRIFSVITKNQTIEVLGTHFNVKSYDDEINSKTTLLEGSVRIKTQNISKNLTPGEQAILQDQKYYIKKITAENEIDWVKGDFIFEQESLVQIMKRVSRWYGVKVFYSKDIDKKQTFSGQVSRSKNLSEVLKCLSTTADIEFTIKNDNIFIN